MSNFLTDGRLALLGALESDPGIGARVRTFFRFGPGLGVRFDLEPSACPALCVTPDGATQSLVANVEKEVAQMLCIQVAVDGQDLEPCEELTALVLTRVSACDETCLGLASQGLTAVRAGSLRWSSLPGRTAARMIWTAHVETELRWRLL
jgi:hypothetical protein